MATSTILEPIRINDEHSAEVLVRALENAESMTRRGDMEHSVKITTDPEIIRKLAAKAMAGAGQG